MKFAQIFPKQPRWLVLCEILLLLAIIGFLDAITGYELSMFVFYGIPIVAAVWLLDQKVAFGIAIMSGIVWWWADAEAGHTYHATWLQSWNVSMRLAFFLFLVVGGSAMKSQRQYFNLQLAVMKRVRLLEQEIVSSSEREQRRIGRDIHDGLCQHLAAVGFVASALKTDLEARGLPEAEAAGEIEKLLKDGISQARDIARGLAPVPMDETGLASALDELAAQMTRGSGVACHFETSGQMDLEPEVASHLYRIAQEAVNNVVKHAQAHYMEITLSGTAQFMELTVSDDGIGFPPRAEEAAGMGLRTMQYRANLIGATLTLRHEEDGGSTVACRRPARSTAPNFAS